ncbi:hypothetical protein [Streptacidiphilus rugosus]|uniref:hypothetical protein n=1 Tax=Streptacidiphilus rugosus TaxID=405783 RepID=UPI00055F3875|nr:hypothetical protein [Streptacidiphilus rugosus]
MTNHTEHPVRRHAWDALAVLLTVTAGLCALFLDVEYAALTVVSRLALGGIIVGAIGVILAKRLIEHRG